MKLLRCLLILLLVLFIVTPSYARIRKRLLGQVDVQVPYVPDGLIHWQIDALGGTVTEKVRLGKIDGAVYSVNASGQVVIPQTDGGGKVRHVRGVWLESVEFTWDGYWAEPRTAGATNYFQSFTNGANETTITLNTTLAEGTQVQVYYYYQSDQTLTANTFFDAYPAWFKCYEGPFPREIQTISNAYKYAAAVDAEQWSVIAALEARDVTGDVVWDAIANAIMQTLIDFEGESMYPYIDDFDYLDTDRKVAGTYTGTGSGDSIDEFSIVYDTTDNKMLKVTATVTSGGYAFWGKGNIFDIKGSPNFQFVFKGQNTQKRYKVKLCDDPNQNQTTATLYYYGFKDTSTTNTTFNIPLSQFYNLINIPYSGNINPTDWTTYGDASVSTVEESVNWNEGGYLHNFAMKTSWDLSGGTYIGSGLGVPSYVDSTGETNVNFYINMPQTMQLKIILHDAGSEQYYYIKNFTSTGITRVSISFSDFTKDPYYQPPGSDNNGVFNHPVKNVFFQVESALGGPTTGNFSVSEIRFGNPYTTSSTVISLYEFWFPEGGTFTAYFDDVGFDIHPVDVYNTLPRFSYQWMDTGRHEWRGPTYTGYLVPAAYYRMGEKTTAQLAAQFMYDAQQEYASRYSVSIGPFMPVYLRYSQENREYGDLDTWTWNGPDTNTHWAGFQYRALAQLAHYYWLSGDSTAKAVLDNWMTWLNTRIQEDSNYPNPPKGYLVPSTFTKDTGNYLYDYFSPNLHALVIQAMIFKYWRDGDSIAQLWYRRLLDDLIYNRKQANGSYKSTYTYGYGNCEVGKALGMLINGREGASINYSLTATNDDKQAFTDLYNYFVNNRGSTKPVALSEDWIPLHTYENVSEPIGEKIWVSNTAATSEDISICLYFAVDYYKYSGDSTWLNKFKQFYLNVLKNKTIK